MPEINLPSSSDNDLADKFSDLFTKKTAIIRDATMGHPRVRPL